MDKAQLIQAMCDRMGNRPAENRRMLDAMLTIIRLSLKTNPVGTRFYVPGLGAFTLYLRAHRAGTNPRTQAAISIPAVKVVRLQVEETLKARLNGF